MGRAGRRRSGLDRNGAQRRNQLVANRAASIGVFDDEMAREADMASAAALAAYGRGVREKVAAWWAAKPDKTCREIVQTYYGPQSLHEVLERATWHIGQHCRQWMMLLDMAGVRFERPLADADFADLPMPKQVWD